MSSLGVYDTLLMTWKSDQYDLYICAQIVATLEADAFFSVSNRLAVI
jgi:hypothetical protein